MAESTPGEPLARSALVAGATDEPGEDGPWVDRLCAAEQKLLRRLAVDGEILRLQAGRWAAETSEAISSLESALAKVEAPDELQDLVANAVGVPHVYRLAEEIGEAALVACRRSV